MRLGGWGVRVGGFAMLALRPADSRHFKHIIGVNLPFLKNQRPKSVKNTLKMAEI
jgi:hypothetical protein